MTLYSEGLGPHIPRFFMGGVFSSTLPGEEARGWEPSQVLLGSTTTVPCRARQGIHEVPGELCADTYVHTHSAGLIAEAATDVLYSLPCCASVPAGLIEPSRLSAFRPPKLTGLPPVQILIPQSLAGPVSCTPQLLGILTSSLALRPPGPGSSS